MPGETNDAGEGGRRHLRGGEHVLRMPGALILGCALLSGPDVRRDGVAQGGFAIRGGESVEKPVEFAPRVAPQRVLSLVVQRPRGFVHRHLGQNLIHVVALRRQVRGQEVRELRVRARLDRERVNQLPADSNLEGVVGEPDAVLGEANERPRRAPGALEVPRAQRSGIAVPEPVVVIVIVGVGVGVGVRARGLDVCGLEGFGRTGAAARGRPLPLPRRRLPALHVPPRRLLGFGSSRVPRPPRPRRRTLRRTLRLLVDGLDRAGAAQVEQLSRDVMRRVRRRERVLHEGEVRVASQPGPVPRRVHRGEPAHLLAVADPRPGAHGVAPRQRANRVLGEGMHLHRKRVVDEHGGEGRPVQLLVQHGRAVGVDGLGDERGVDQNRRESMQRDVNRHRVLFRVELGAPSRRGRELGVAAEDERLARSLAVRPVRRGVHRLPQRPAQVPRGSCLVQRRKPEGGGAPGIGGIVGKPGFESLRQRARRRRVRHRVAEAVPPRGRRATPSLIRDARRPATLQRGDRGDRGLIVSASAVFFLGLRGLVVFGLAVLGRQAIRGDGGSLPKGGHDDHLRGHRVDPIAPLALHVLAVLLDVRVHALHRAKRGERDLQQAVVAGANTKPNRPVPILLPRLCRRRGDPVPRHGSLGQTHAQVVARPRVQPGLDPLARGIDHAVGATG
mmetsp:Transcript_7609/g.33575  ORF Transcript_7609/g.33575 Transcript_7609/m.33575 type:complete len:673 (+) Transcript_7609:1023-3041(+)